MGSPTWTPVVDRDGENNTKGVPSRFLPSAMTDKGKYFKSVWERSK